MTRDPFENRSFARSPKNKSPFGNNSIQLPPPVQEKKENVQELENIIKVNIENIEAKMRETQNKMKMLERERALMNKRDSKACFIF